MSTKYTYEEMCGYLFREYAPAFNFEKDAEELLELALERGLVDMYITAHEEGADPDTYTRYGINKDW